MRFTGFVLEFTDGSVPGQVCVLLVTERFISVLMVNKDIKVLWLHIRALLYVRDPDELELLHKTKGVVCTCQSTIHSQHKKKEN